MFEISDEQKKELLKYLAKRPYIEVAGLVAMIAGLSREIPITEYSPKKLKCLLLGTEIPVKNR